MTIVISISSRPILDYFHFENFKVETPVHFPIIDGVAYLSENTYEEAITSNENVLILFFAHWCPHCKRAFPKFAEASKEAKKYNFLFASVNGDFYRNLLTKYGIRGFPTIIYFSNYGKEFSTYNGNLGSKDDFIEWIYRKKVNPLREINSVEQIKKEFENNNKISYIYFGNNPDEINIIKAKAEKDFNHIYGHVKDEKIIAAAIRLSRETLKNIKQNQTQLQCLLPMTKEFIIAKKK